MPVFEPAFIDPSAPNAPNAHNPPNALIAACERLLRHAPGSDLSHLARDLAVSRRTLQRMLASAGIPFRRLRTHIQLERADALLATSDRSIGAIAELVGFASSAHFSVWFRRHRGTTPGASRSSGARP